jgi:carbamoyltransferase
MVKSLYLGPNTHTLPEFEKEIKRITPQEIATFIWQNEIVAIFQGRSEAGPRALGNRSILFNPCNPKAKDIVNRVKGRESFRPFAATVLKEHAHEWFDLAGMEESPSMMYAVDALPSVYDKIPGVLHVDKTCRIQTLTEEQNPVYYELIKAFQVYSKVPLVFNTSFNLAGEPLVESPTDAIDTFNRSDIRVLWFPEARKAFVKPNVEP